MTKWLFLVHRLNYKKICDLRRDYIVQQSMRKASNASLGIRHSNSQRQPRKEDHFSYFESLEQRLLQQSDKITNLIGVRTLSNSQTRSTKDTKILRHKNSQSSLLQLCDSMNDFDEPQQDKRPLTLLQAHLLIKKNELVSSKSQHFTSPRQKANQLQRKLTYCLIRPQQQIPTPQSISPSKSQTIAQCLKKTASTTSSSAALIRTIDQIKRMHSKASLIPQPVSIDKGKPLSVDDFQILKYLEQGQFGSVYLTRHKTTNFLFALKKIPKAIFMGEMKFIYQLIRQIKIQSYLDHPNIVQLYAFFSDQDYLYLVLELCFGGNVYSKLKNQGRFQEQKVKQIIKQVSHAIQFMHDSDIIHRDIKPQNILLHGDVAKVCDFGWSIHSPLLRDTRCGTPLYSSPEVVKNQQYDNKIDVWNIGILTYELLYGRVPFQIRTEQDLVKVVDEDIYFSKNVLITSQAKDFILKCLIKNPKDRFPMAKLVDHQFINNN